MLCKGDDMVKVITSTGSALFRSDYTIREHNVVCMHYSKQKEQEKFLENYFRLQFDIFSERSPSRGDRVEWVGLIARTSSLVGAGQAAVAHYPVETN